MENPARSPSSEEASAKKQETEHPTHNPSAPSHEAFDVSTTVDPSYIIHLIRQLLPSKIGKHLNRNEARDLPFEGPASEKAAMEDRIENGEAPQCSCTEDEIVQTAESFGEVDVPAGPVGDRLYLPQKKHDVSEEEASWEEYGCTLWDLAASETNAQLMVENFILDVLLANLMVSHSARVKEIGLGIIGNLACHEVTRSQISCKDKLTETIVEQLFLDDAPCLCEAFRLITSCFLFDDAITWTEVLRFDHVLSRILWIIENALNTQLIEKSVGFILAVLSAQENIIAVLLPPLVNLGLPRILVNLLEFEMNKLMQEGIYERVSVLDKVVQVIEAFSGVDEFSAHICTNKELFKLLINLVKLPSKNEVSSSSVTAAVLIANILHGTVDIATEVSRDVDFLQGILSIFSFASDDTEAKSALWSITARVLRSVEENTMSTLDLRWCVSILVSNYHLIEEALLDHEVEDDSNEDGNNLSRSSTGLNDRTISLKLISNTLREWKRLKANGREIACFDEVHVDDEDVDRLLQCCSRFG